ncbi:MAG: purine-binding chemotaxis protein CheW, partial [Planctomycetes bacterium]|nr:purine-binding chemotaxis protein CheW [Planctomycetota bacterium]
MSNLAISQKLQAGIESQSAGNQYLTFMLAGEEYGIDILRVREIKGLENATQIPNTPPHVLGVINLRGNVIPVVDLRLRFGMERVEYNQLTVVIVVRAQCADRERTIGLVVDTVSDVYNIQSEGVHPSPDFGSAVDTSFVQGIASVDDK